MDQKELSLFYERRRTHFWALLDTETKKINRISNIRIVCAISIVILIYFGFRNTPLLYAIVPLIALFVVLVKRHTKLFVYKVHLENLVRINSLEMDAVKSKISGFFAGTEFIDPHHPYTHDLDIFGEGSLFQCINRCNTRLGKAAMASQLSNHLRTADDIRETQHAIKDVSARTDFRQDMQAAGMEIDEQVNDRRELLAWLKVTPIVYGNPVVRIILWVLPSITVLALTGAIWFGLPTGIVLLLILAQWVFFGVYAERIKVFHEYISRKKSILEKYGHILKVFQREQFTSKKLVHLKSKAEDADVKLGQLASLVTALNARLNFMTAFVVNSLLMYDLQCVYRLEKWKNENASNLQGWLDAISETESLCSMGTFAFNNPRFIFPDIHNDMAIHAESIGHPLLGSGTCVTNDLDIGKDASVLIITGANMAGKSTFLRTMGVNLVLALAGAPVYARVFSCPVIQIRSGMRTADSLKDNESYFYAELNRLKSIMDDLRNGTRLFILLDEILKGTNSGDKQRGSIALVKQLLINPCLAIVATHDLALGDLEKEYPRRVTNYCFEPNIENDQLSFDYKLKPGLAQKMNATFLMKKMGIIAE